MHFFCCCENLGSLGPLSHRPAVGKFHIRQVKSQNLTPIRMPNIRISWDVVQQKRLFCSSLLTSLELTKEVPNEAKVENTGKASDTCDLPHKCLICNQKFSKENYLEAHVFMTHENNDTKLSSCDNNLETNESAHAVEKTFSCFQFNYKCQISRDLKRHERIHTGEKPFKCSHCDKKCRTKANLKEHERIHTGNKPFSCSYCDYKCSRSSTLKTHERTHTGDKPYSCSQCEYKCSTSSNLKSHERIHKGEKPYSCGSCDKKFTWLSHLKRHEKNHTSSTTSSFLKEIKEEPS